MAKPIAVTVLICTCNRAARLGLTLEHFVAMRPPTAFGLHVLVVDNNSADHTPTVVASARARATIPIGYAREARQGKSFALNTGLEMATGDILALTDDDVQPAYDWVTRLVEAFRDDQVVFVGGKVLPRWHVVPPPWLLTQDAQDVWGPLALVDYGDRPRRYDGRVGDRRPIGANMAIRREAMLAIGGWRTDLGKAGNTLMSGEDHEIFFRLADAGLYRGVWMPDVIVYHDVPAHRLTRRYFRQWFFASGRARALMLTELYGHDADTRFLGGVPRFLYGQLAEHLWGCMQFRLRRDPVAYLVQELRTIRLAGTVWERWRRPHAPRARRLLHPSR